MPRMLRGRMATTGSGRPMMKRIGQRGEKLVPWQPLAMSGKCQSVSHTSRGRILYPP